MLRSCIGFIALALAVVTASAQECSLTGSFQPLSPHFIHSNNTSGYLIQGSTIFIDADADGIVGPSDPGDRNHPLPTELSGGDGPLNVRLSPTREFLFSAGGTSGLVSGSCSDSGRRVRIYRLPGITGEPLQLIVDDCLTCQGFDGGVPLWYDMGVTNGGAGGQPPLPNSSPLSHLRYAYIRTSTSGSFCDSATSQPALRFYDLNTGDKATYSLGLEPGAGVTRVSPGGEFLLFQHDLTNNPADSDVVMLRMCDITSITQIIGSPPSLNNVSIVGINAAVTASSSTGASLSIRNSSQQVMWTAQSDCCDAGGDLGACCVGNSCSISLLQNCAGVWTPGVTCSQSGCGTSAAVLSASIIAPANVTAGGTGTIRVRVSNTGGSTANGVVVRLQSPSTSYFRFSAPVPSGTLGFNGSTVTWNVGSISAGAVQEFTATLNVQCFTGTHTFTSVTTATGLAAVNSSRSTTINPVPIYPIDITVQSVPSTTPPLSDGDTIVHTITLTNTSSNAQSNLTIPGGITTGRNMTFTSIDSCGGGTCTIASPFLLTWNGALAGNQTIQLVFTTTVGPCHDATFPRTALMNGGSISVAGLCSNYAGTSANIPLIEISPAVYAVVEAVNLQPGSLGTAQTAAATNTGATIQYVRGTPDLQVRVRLVNNRNTAATIDSAFINTSQFDIITSPTNGAIYDSNLQQVIFVGSIPANGSTTFEFGARALDGNITNELAVARQTQVCLTPLGSLRLIPMVDVPAGPYVLSINTFFGSGVAMLERGVDTRLEGFFASINQWNAITRGDNNDAWLIGQTLVRFNLASLEFESFPQISACLATPTGILLTEGVYQASTGDLILYGQVPGATTGTLLRFSPSTGACAIIADNIAASIRPNTENRVQIDSVTNDILVNNHDTLERFVASAVSPLNPGDRQNITIAGPTYNITDSGPVTTQRIWSATPLCTGQWAVMHATEFMNPLQGLPARIFAASMYDPSTQILTVLDPMLGGEAYNACCGWNHGQSVAPVFNVTYPYQAEFTTATFIEAEPGELMFGTNSYPAFAVGTIDSTNGTVSYLQSPYNFQFTGARDIAYFQPALSGCGTPCPADFNQDGGIDGADVQDFFTAWSNGDPSADVNFDGGVDGADVGDFFTAWSNGGC